jgi:1A family penicillin-binding protein
MSSDLPGGGRRARHQKRRNQLSVPRLPRLPRIGRQAPADRKGEGDAEDRTLIYHQGNWLQQRWLALRLAWADRRTRGKIIWGVAGAFLLIFLVLLLLPLPEPVIPYATVIYDVNDEVAGRLFTQSRIEVPLTEMSKDLPNAVVASEDSRFYRHRGVDPIGIGRALVRDITSGRIVEGGSTLTQQLAKNLYTSGRRTWIRKIYDAFLAIKLESRYSKEDILELYLNTSYLGNGAYGVEVASQQYFGKSAKDLTLPESAMLVGLLPLPEAYSPFKNLDTAIEKRNVVLTKMADQGYISDAQATQAKKAKVHLATRKPLAGEAQYFTAYVVDQVLSRHPNIADIYTGGYQIHTTLDLKAQRAANDAFERGFSGSETDANGVPQPEGALVAMDPRTGEIKAMIGGRDFAKTQLNRAYQSFRQPGSAFKPFLYTSVIEKGYTAASTQVCEPVSFPSGTSQPYEPTDYGTSPYHYAPMTVRRAIQISDNISAVKWANQVSPRTLADYARKMGVSSQLSPTLALALGASEVSPLELCIGYSTIANGGLAVQPLSILKVTDKHGNVIEENRPSSTRVISERNAYIVANMMTSVLKPGGTGSFLASVIGRPAAAKTGTTNSQRDAWFAGFTPELCCAVWVGHDDPSRTLPGGGGRTAGPIWANFIAGALRGQAATEFTEPAGMQHGDVCQVTGLLANPSCPSVYETFAPGTLPTGTCPWGHDPSDPYRLPDVPYVPPTELPGVTPPGETTPGTPGTPTEPGGPTTPGMLSQFWDWLNRPGRSP